MQYFKIYPTERIAARFCFAERCASFHFPCSCSSFREWPGCGFRVLLKFLDLQIFYIRAFETCWKFEFSTIQGRFLIFEDDIFGNPKFECYEKFSNFIFLLEKLDNDPYAISGRYWSCRQCPIGRSSGRNPQCCPPASVEGALKQKF